MAVKGFAVKLGDFIILTHYIMRYPFLILFLVGLAPYCFGQQSALNEASGLETFLSRTGEMILTTDYKLTPINIGLSGFLDAKIRKAIIATETRYYYSLQKDRQMSNMSWFIEYSDLLEMIKAVATLRAGLTDAINEKADYKENRFVTRDKLKVGYYIEEGKVQWYITADRNLSTPIYKTVGVVLLKDVALLEQSLQEGKLKIESLRAQPR